MKELEHNQKINARWKVWAFLVFAFVLGITFVLATHNAYAGSGDVTLETTKEKIEKDLSNWEKERKNLLAQKKDLSQKLKACKADNNPKEKLRDCKLEKELVLADIERVVGELLRCEQRLSAAKRDN